LNENEEDYTVNETIREAVLDRLAIEQSMWFAKLEVAGTLDLNAPGFWGERSLRDLIVHLNFWQQYKNDRLGAAIDGAEAEQVDAINAFALEQAAGTSGKDVIGESHRRWNEQFAIIERLPNDLLTSPGRFAMFDGKSLADSVSTGSYFEHYHDEHGPELAKLSS
jgi:hypothetical protein